MKTKISIVIPTYNERKNIKNIINEVIKKKIVKEIIFVDDSSNDGTLAEIKKYSIIFKNKVFFISRSRKKRNLSKSVLEGFFLAKNKYVLVMDCDLQHDTGYIDYLYQIIKNSRFDIVVASRFLKKKMIGNLGLLRSMLSIFCIYLIHFFF